MTTPAFSTAASALAVPGPMVLTSLGHCGTHWVAAVMLTVMPFIATDLGLSYTEVGFLLSVFYVSSAAANLPSGIVVDVTGRRVLFQAVALVVGALGLAAFVVAESSVALAAAIAVIGITNMLWHPAAISYLSLVYPARRGYALAIHSLGANLGDALGPFAAGAMLAALSWKTTSFFNAIPVLLSAALIFFLLNRSHATQPAPHVDTGGVRQYLAGMAALLKRRAIWLLALLSGFRSMTQYGLLAFLPLYLTHDLKVGPFWMGLTLAVLQIGGIIAAPIAGALSDRVGRRPIVLMGLGATTVIIAGLTFVTSIPLYVAGVAFLGFFMYALRPVIHGWMMDMAPKELGGSVTSLVFGAQSGLAALMPLIGGALADLYGLISVFYFLAASVLAANVLTLFVPKEEGDVPIRPSGS
ncbi:MAG: MFS transporter [Rhodospirillales bacterium]|nr:MFS transporter [Rhodospirillales bacterium]